MPVYEAGEDDGELFIAMRYVDGIDLGVLVYLALGAGSPRRGRRDRAPRSRGRSTRRTSAS